MDLNSILTIASLIAVVIFIVIMYLRAKNKTINITEDELNTFGKILEHIKLKLVALDKGELSPTLTNEQFERAYRRKARTREALINCVHGIESAKIVVIDLIRNIIAEDVKPETITALLGLDTGFLPPPQIQFEILLYKYKKRHGKRALAELIEKYRFSSKQADENASYYVTVQDLETAFIEENIHLEIEEQTELLAMLIFQKYKGFGVIDTIREMDIDGINLGTSGALLPQVKQTLSAEFKVENSVWIYYGGKHIHLRFLTLETEDELRRIVLSLIRYGSKGSLTQNVGRIVATAPDKARITALCPPAAECWAVFIRKFGFSGKTPEQLLIKPYTNNGMLAVQLLEFLMRGMVTTAVTGRQGSGKTTLMTSVIGYIDPRYTLRTLEMAFGAIRS